MAKTGLRNKANETPKFKVLVTPVASAAVVHIRFTASSVFAEFVSARWHMLANFQVSPRVLGNNNNDVGP